VAAAIELRRVSKVFRLRHNAARSLKVRLIGLYNRRHRERVEEFWALREVDLTVRPGECLGLIGPNGSGKSTLLRVMAGILPPTTGEVVVRGRVAPMIELGVGFHPDLTGEENIYLNASLFGLSRRDTEAVYRDVVAFSELGRFIDQPVKSYSSGMYMRLGFSIAVHLTADILLIDEILAVGDEAFQQKCLKRMAEFRERGTTIVLVSHSLGMIEEMCDRACLLARGRLEADGDPEKVVARYREILSIA
jgi:ABC-2 type transport system ATP-binding protein